MQITTEHDIGDTVYAVWRHYDTDKWGVIGPVEISSIDVSIGRHRRRLVTYAFLETDAQVRGGKVLKEKQHAKITAKRMNEK